MASDAGATGARDPDAGVTTFEQLPRDVKNEIPGPTNLPEPADLGRLRAVSHWMRAAVDATGREIKEVSDKEAAKLGYVSLLKDRLSRGVLDYTGYLKGYLCEAAARKGDLEELKALGADCGWFGEKVCARAAQGGHLETLKWLRENDCEWDMQTCRKAAKHGHLDVLKWARANGCPWNKETCEYAARNGHLETLKWARANGCPWDKYTCEYAAQAGHFDVLKWARENGCPWDEWTCMYAARSGLLPSSP